MTREQNINYWNQAIKDAEARGDKTTADFAREQVAIWTKKRASFSPFGGALGSGADTGSLQP